MKASRTAALIALNLVLCAGLAQGKTGDNEQPVNVVATRSDVDNKTGNVIYTGNVVITQGSLKLQADKVTLYRSKDGSELERMVADGHPAIYNQLTDKNEPVEGRARQIDYATASGIVVFLTEVKLTQGGGDTMEANRVEYDTNKNTVQATATEGGRVTSVYLPRKKGETPKPETENKDKAQ